MELIKNTLKNSILLILVNLILSGQVSSKENNISKNDTSSISSSNICTAVMAVSTYYAISMYIMGKTWYKDKDIVPFHFYNDNSGYLQVDKFGHAFGAYTYSFIGYHGLKMMGMNNLESLIYGGSLGFIMQAPIEIMDGIHEGYGFSWGDIIANTLGSGIVISQQLLFDNQLVKYKFTYWKSKYSESANGMLGTSFIDGIFKDYNAHTYWLSLPINAIHNNNNIPEWLNFAVGYGAGGMYGEFTNESTYHGVDLPKTERYRRILISLDIDWTKIRTESTILKTILDGFTLVKVPFPAVEINSKGEVLLHLIYY